MVARYRLVKEFGIHFSTKAEEKLRARGDDVKRDKLRNDGHIQ